MMEEEEEVVGPSPVGEGEGLRGRARRAGAGGGARRSPAREGTPRALCGEEITERRERGRRDSGAKRGEEKNKPASFQRGCGKAKSFAR